MMWGRLSMVRSFVLLGLLFFFQTLNTADAMDKIYDAKTITLPNAMQVVVVENHRTPAVTHMVWYRIGGADEPMGESGLAHFLEHLMFKGTDLVPSGEFSKKVKSWGGNDNAFTSWDFTAYFQTVPKDKLKSVMIMESDRMKNLNFDDAEAYTERDVIVQERKQRTDSNPSAQLSEAMRSTLFVNHPYARPIIGWDQELEKLDPVAARAFYKKYYAPKNAILVVSGDVDAKEVFEMASQYYGDIDNGEASSRPDWPTIPETYGSATIHHTHSSVQQPIWRKMYRVPGIGQDYKSALSLSVAEIILGGNTGRFYKHMVVDNPLAATVSFSYGGVSVDDSTVSLTVAPREEVRDSQIVAGVTHVLNDVATNGVDQGEIDDAVKQLQAEAVFERDSLTGPAMMLGYQLISGVSLEQAETWVHDLASVTPEDVKQVIADYFIPQAPSYHAVTGYLLPKGK